LNAVAGHQGLSIYAIAKLADVPYRRAHAHVGRLVELGLMQKRMDDSGPRKIARPYTMQ
jgi:DNA-binding IclR family transcriptional regulator